MIQYEIDNYISSGSEYALAITCAMIDDFALNNGTRAAKRALDAITVWSNVDVLKFYNLNGADTELTDSDLNDCMDKISEYEYASMLDLTDYTYQVGTDADALGGGGTVVFVNGSGTGVTVPTSRSYTWTVTSDGQTVFTMPFNASAVDTDSISVTLNSVLDPQLDIDYTLSGTTFTWTSSLYLTTGMRFEIKWTA